MRKREIEKYWRMVDKVSKAIENLPPPQIPKGRRGWITRVLKSVRWVKGYTKP